MSSNVLGLNTGSAAVLGGAGSFGSAVLGRSGERVYVNAATGNLVIQGQDEWLAAIGPGAQGLRTYNSQGQHLDDNGDNWMLGLARSVRLQGGVVNTAGSTAVRVDEDGSEAVFSWDASRGRYISTDGAGAHDSLSYDTSSGQWTYVEGSSRRSEVYAGNGKLHSVTDAAGNSLTLGYNGAGLVSSATTSAGEVSYYDYNASHQLTQIRTLTRKSAGAAVDQTLTRVRYSYDASNRLAGVVVDLSPEDSSMADGRVFSTQYTYDGSSTRVASIVQSDGVRLGFTYEGERLKTVTDALGGVSSFSYDLGNRRTMVTDALGQAYTYHYDTAGRLLRVDSPAVGGVVSSAHYEYNANGDVTQIRDGLGRAVNLEHDAWGNVVRQTDAAGQVTRRVYNALSQLVSETVATQGEPGAMASATRYVYDASGVRLRYVISAEGRVSEYRYDSQGQRVASIQYAGGLYPLAGRGWDSVPSEAEMGSWAGSQDLGRTQRVDYAYDWRGQLARSTSYDAVDGAGNGQGAALTQYVYDGAGRLIKTVDARNGVTQTVYDGLGRVVSVVNALNQVSTTLYDDAGGAVVHHDFGGLVSTSLYDKLGRLVSVQQASAASAPFVASAGMAMQGSNWSKSHGAGEGWNQGVYARQGIAGGAVVSFRPEQTNKFLMIGLNVDPAADHSDASIDWGLYCTSSSVLQVFENGVYKGDVGPYAAGDDLSVSYDGNAVRYMRNGVVLRSVVVSIQAPLYADSSFYTPGAAVSDVRFEPYVPPEGLFIGEAGTVVDGRRATKSAGAGDDWSSAFRSRVGYTGGASVSFKPDQTSAHFMVGLNTDPASNTSYASLDWAWYAAGDNGLYVYENGNEIGRFSTYAAGDQLSVSYDGTAIRYIKNGVVLRSVTVAISQPLYADSSLYHQGTGISDLVFEPGATLGGVRSYYDAASQLKMTQNAAGTRQWFLHDAAGRLVGSVDALGVLTETLYNPAGQVTQTVRYANLVDVTRLVDAQGRPTALALADIRPAASAADARSWNLYDSAGRLSKTLTPTGAQGSAQGSVTEFIYSASGQLLLTRRYANAIGTSGLGAELAPSQAAPAASSQDQILRSFYDRDGLLVGSLDATGSLRENQYDAAGRLTAAVQRAARLSSAQTSQAWITGTELAQLSPGQGAGDQQTLNFYNARGQRVGQLDGEGGFIETLYDATGNVSATLLYGTRTAGFSATSALASLRAAGGSVQTRTVYEYDAINRVLRQRVDPNGLDITTTTVYDEVNRQLIITAPGGLTRVTQMDALGRVLSETTDPAGLRLTTTYAYDVVGRVVSSTDASGTVTVYGYDALGRKTTQRVDPAGLNLLTQYAYDAQGNLARVIDPKGAHTRYLYDTQGRLQYTLDAEYSLTGHEYDALGQLAKTVRYAQQQTGIQTFDIGSGLIRHSLPTVATRLADSVTYYKYDTAGRKIGEVDAEGGITEFVYDTAGRVTKTIQYANGAKNLLSNGSFESGTQGYGSWSADGGSINFGSNLNPDWTVAGQGTLWLRQGASTAPAVINNSPQGTKVIAGQRYHVSVAAAVHRTSAYVQVYFIGGNGQVVGLGNLYGGQTSMGYEEATGGSLINQYKVLSGYVEAPYGAEYIVVDVVKNGTPPDKADSYLFLANMAVRLTNPAAVDEQGWRPQPDASRDQVSYYKYDAAGRKIGEIDAGGGVTEFFHDTAGRITKTIQYANGAQSLLSNGNFENGTQGYTSWSLDGGSIEFGSNLHPVWTVANQGTLWLRQGASTTSAVINSGPQNTKVVAGQRYYVSVAAAVHRASAQLQVYFLDHNNQLIWGNLTGGEASMAYEEATGGSLISQYKVLSGYVEAPYGAERIVVEVVKSGTVSGHQDSYLFVANMSVRSVNPAAADAVDWRPRVDALRDRVTYYKYDAAGRKVGEVDAEGGITEFVYDTAGRVTKTIQYANSAKNLLSNGSFENGTQGYTAWSSGPGHLQFGSNLNPDWTVAGQGTLWLSQEGDSNYAVINNGAQSNAVIPGQRYYVSALVGVHRASASLDVYFRDANGNRINAPLSGGTSSMGVQEAVGGALLSDYKELSGYITAPAGAAYIGVDLIKSHTVGGAIDSYMFVANMSVRSVNPAAADAVDWRPRVDALRDRVTYYKYDAAGRKIGEVDAEGSITEFVYDTAGRVTKTIQYANSAKNLLSNGSFENGTQGYTAWSSGPGHLQFGSNLNPDWTVAGQGTLWLSQEGDSNYAVINNGAQSNAVIPGQRYYVSALVGVHRASASLDVYFRDANGNRINAPLSGGTSSMGVQEAVGGASLSDYKELSGYITAPAGAAYIGVDLIKSHTVGGAVDSYMFVANMSVRSVNPASDVNWRPDASASDRITRYTYDAAGRLVYETDALGGVQKYRYDAGGRVVESVRYGQRYSGATDEGSLQAYYASHTSSLDRSTKRVYDQAGRLRFTVDALGGVVQTQYDALGRVARTIAYESPINPASVNAASTPEAVLALLPTSTLGAREAIYTYDASGRLVHTATSQTQDGSTKFFGITRQHYDALGRITHTIRYSTTVSLSDLAGVLTVQQLDARLVSSGANDRTQSYAYDATGRLTRSTDGEGYSEHFSYDALGNKRSYTNKNGAVFSYEYDTLGRLVLERSPEVVLAGLDAQLNLAPQTQAVQTRLSYDSFGQLIERTEAWGRPEQRSTRYGYDALGRQTRVSYEAVGVYNPGADSLSSNGAGGASVARTESSTALYSQTVYDVFGQAIINRDVGGGLSYKTYDALGRLVHEIDANHQVSTHFYSALVGEYSGLTRLENTAVFADGLNVSSGTLNAAVAAAASGGTPRTVSTYYDKLGRAAVSYDQYSRSDFSGTAFRYNATLDQAASSRGSVRYEYNTWGEQVSQAQVLDANATQLATTRYAYDLGGRLSRELNAQGYLTQYWSNAFGEQTQVTQFAQAIDPNGSIWANPPSLRPDTQPGSAVGYDRSVQYDYDRRGQRVRQVELAVEIGQRLGAHSLGQQSANRISTSTYDGLGHLTRQVQASYTLDGHWLSDGDTLARGYDALGREIWRIDAGGRAQSYAVDALGRVLRSTAHATLANASTPPAASAQDLHTTQVFDKLGRLLQRRDATGAQSFFSYDARGQLAKQWNPYTEWSLLEGVPTSSAAQASPGATRNTIELFRYDKTGRLLDTTTLTQRDRQDALSWSTDSAEYNAFGEVTARRRDGALYEQNWYDVGGQLWKTQSGGVSRVNWYDLQGNLTSSFTSTTQDLGALGAAQDVAPGQARRILSRFDRLGRLLSQDAPGVLHDNGATTWLVTSQLLDAWGNVLQRSVNGTARQSYRYNERNQLISESLLNTTSLSATGTTTTGTLTKQVYYDAWGRNIGSRDAAGNTHTATYTSAHQIDTEFHANGGQVHYTYDAWGRTLTKTDEIGRVYRYSYDNAGRETGRTVQEGPSGPTHQLATSLYDELGRKIRETSGADSAYSGQSQLYWYDARGLMVRSAQPLGQNTLYWYNGAGLKTQERDANGLFSTWGYNAWGQLNAHTDLGGATYGYTYNLAGELTRQTSSRGQDLNYQYLANGALKQVSDAYRRSATRYDYDAEGNRTREVFTNDGVVYRNTTSTYDNQGRLITARDDSASSPYSLSIAYDAAGNRRRIWGNTIYYSVDSALGTIGNSGPEAFDQWFTYDSMNRVLVNAGKFSNGAVSEFDAANVYSYDDAGRRRLDTSKSLGWQGVPYGSQQVYSYDFADRLVKQERQALSGANLTPGAAQTDRLVSYDHAQGRQTDTVYVRDAATGAAYRLDVADIRFNANGQTISRTDYVQGLDTSFTTQTAQYFSARQTLSYDGAGNLARVDVMGYAPTHSAGDWRQVKTTYHSSTSRYDYSYVLFEGYKERGQALTGVSIAPNGVETAYVPSQSVLSYDANGHLAQLQRSSLDTQWFVTDTAGHITANWGAQATSWGSGLYPQDASLKVWNPNSLSLSGSAGALAAMPTPPALSSPTNANSVYWETQLFLNDQHIGGLYQTQDLTENYDWDGNPFYSVRTTLSSTVDLAAVGQSRPTQGSAQNYTVQEGDTARALAQRFYGDASLWYAIVEANALASSAALPPGRVIKIPQLVRSANTAASYAVYQPSSLIGATSPEVTLPTPPLPKPGGCGTLGTLIIIVVVAVVIYVTKGWAADALAKMAPTAMASGTTASAVASSAIAAAAGSVVGQGLSMAMGMQERFSWKQVGLSAIGGAVGGGMGQVGGLNSMTQAALSNALTQGIGVVTGLQDSFDWRSVAVSALAAPIADKLSKSTASALQSQGSVAAARTAAAAVRGLVTQSVRMLVYRQGSIDFAAIAADSFGNALGESLASQSQPEPSVPGVASAEEKAAILELFKGGPGVAPASAYTGGQAWAADVASRRAGSNARQVDELLAGVGSGGVNVDTRPGSVYVQAGDSLSKIAARFPEYGNTNDLKNQLIAANPQLRDPNALSEGMELNFPGAGTVVDRDAMARAVGADGRYQTAMAAQQPDAQEPVWNMRDASAALRGQGSAPAVGSSEWFRTASDAELHAAGYQTARAYDQAEAARIAMERQRAGTAIGIAAGGPVFTGLAAGARLFGAPDNVVNDIGVAQTGLVMSLAAPLASQGAVIARPLDPRFDPSVEAFINLGKQSRHVLGTREYESPTGGKSYFRQVSDAQDVLSAYQSGQAVVVGRGNDGGPIVRFDGGVGFNHNPRAGFPNQPTNVYWIKGSSSVSVVPVSPTKGQ